MSNENAGKPGFFRAVVDNDILRALFILSPFILAVKAPDFLKTMPAEPAWMWWLFPAIMIWFVFWFLIIRWLIFYVWIPFDRRNNWLLTLDKASSALLRDVLDYTESNNDATRALVISGFGFYLTYLMLPYAESSVVWTMGAASAALVIVSFMLQRVFNLGKRLGDPLYQLIMAANDEDRVVKTIHEEIESNEKEREKFDAYRQKWRRLYTANPELIDNMLLTTERLFRRKKREEL